MVAFPNASAFRAARPAELGLVALRGLAHIRSVRSPRAQPIDEHAFIEDIVNGVDGCAEGRDAAAEAVAWLQSHDLVAAVYDGGSPSLFVTKLGMDVLQTTAAADGGLAMAVRAIDLVPIAIRARVTGPLLAGDYDLAVVAACKAVEVRMREKANLSTSDFGPALARKFFKRVSHTRLQHAERRGNLSDEEHLFEGLFGMYRNRAAHEMPHVDSAEYALEVIAIAAHLLRIVEAAQLEEVEAVS